MLNLQRERLSQAQSHHQDVVPPENVLPGPTPYRPEIQPPYVFPPGWYDDGQGAVRWFDGYVWTPHTR